MEDCMMNQPEDDGWEYPDPAYDPPDPHFIQCCACFRFVWIFVFSAFCDECWGDAE
jgi:hypothetical protein